MSLFVLLSSLKIRAGITKFQGSNSCTILIIYIADNDLQRLITILAYIDRRMAPSALSSKLLVRPILVHTGTEKYPTHQR